MILARKEKITGEKMKRMGQESIAVIIHNLPIYTGPHSEDSQDYEVVHMMVRVVKL